MIVHTKPNSGYESFSTCCLDFLGFGENYVPDSSMMNRIQALAGFTIMMCFDEMVEALDKVDIIYKKLTENELERFIQMRINQLREEGATEDIDLVPILKEYYNTHMADGTFVSYLAMDGNEIIGTSGMSFVEKPPYFGCPTGKIGLLSSMFTDPEYRRMGIARELLTRVIDEARKYGCGTVQITASDMGVKLYSNFGFVHNDNFMNYKL